MSFLCTVLEVSRILIICIYVIHMCCTRSTVNGQVYYYPARCPRPRCPRPNLTVKLHEIHVNIVMSRKSKKRSRKSGKSDDWRNSFGAQAGSTLGAYAGYGIQRAAQLITGLGEYHVKRNVLIGVGATVANADPRGGTVVRHREYLGDVITSSTIGAFKNTAYLLNPGNPDCFPWLSGIASNYEEYCFEGVIFEYRSMSADALNSTNTALGSVIMSTGYDCTDPLFASKSEMENYEFSSSCKPSVDMVHPIECEPRQTAISTELYLAPNITVISGVAANQDPRLYFWGIFQIATVGFQAASVNIGELWVTYQVSLLKPKMWVSIGNMSRYAHYTCTAVTTANCFGTANTKLYDSVGLTVPTSGTTLTFAATSSIATYLVMHRVIAAGAGAVGFSGYVATNITVLSAWPATANSGTNDLVMQYTFAVRTTGLPIATTLALTYTGFGSGAATCDLIVTQVPNNLV